MTAPQGVPVWADGGAAWPPRPALAGDCSADVAIVGAGFTGLWAAYYLLKEDPALRVVVLEREHAGFGASGRNGGWCSAIFPVSLDRVRRLYSRTAAVELQRAMNETVREVGRVTSAESIDCDFAAKGYVSLARTPAQLARARATVAAAGSFGIKDQWQYLNGAQARAVINADGALGGVYTRHCALLHPGKLVRGLAARVEGLGGTIYENTAVTGIAKGCVRTRLGTITAPVIVRATEAFTPQLAGHRRAVVPLYSMAVATAPLPDAIRQDLGLDARVAFNDLRNLRIYAHPTADGRLVFGGRGAPYHFGSKVTPQYDVDAGIHDKIIQTLGEFFPALAGARITHRWGGPLGVPRDWFPSAGYNAASGLAWAGPYAGDGVATSNLAGRILRNLITGRQDELSRLPVANHASPRWEVEPLRWIAVNAGLRAAAAADHEEHLTSKPSHVADLLERLTGAH